MADLDLTYLTGLLAGDVILGVWGIPWDVYSAIYSYVRRVDQISDPFEPGHDCWKFACYLGIAAAESAYTFNMAIVGDAAEDAWSGPAKTCCDYWICLTDIACGDGMTAWDKAREHAPYGDYGAYLSHGIFQLYVCGQGASYVCDPARLHNLTIHMRTALPPIGNAVVNYWDASNVEQSVRTVAQYSGHPGIVGDYDHRITNIWNATDYIQPYLYEFLLGDEPSPAESPLPPIPSGYAPSPLPRIEGPSGVYPLPPMP